MDLVEAQLREQLKLQSAINSTVNPDWAKAGYHWPLAIAMEGAELIEHHGWKWWKRQDKDINQLKLELVDIWHFILSDALVRNDSNVDLALHELSMHMRHPQTAVFIGYAPRNLGTMDDVSLVRAFVALAMGDIISHTAFALMTKRFDLSFDQLHTLYIAKNVLNIFRQEHGYKDGTYKKVWRGIEDNDVLTNLIQTMPNASPRWLLERLEVLYSRITKETS